MKRLIICFLTAIAIHSFGQEAQERILYVVDSIPIINDPDKDDGELTEQDIETVTVVTNKDEIEKLGYKDLDKLIFIITKEYAKRPDELKKIPTLAQMERIDGRWFIKNTQTPYTGQFIELYMNGKLKGKGNFKDGLAEATKAEVNQINIKQDSINYFIQIISEQLKQTKDYRITNRNCEVRLKPKSKTIIISKIPKHFELVVLQVQHKWVLVSYFDPKDNLPQTGWIMKKYLDKPE